MPTVNFSLCFKSSWGNALSYHLVMWKNQTLPSKYSDKSRCIFSKEQPWKGLWRKSYRNTLSSSEVRNQLKKIEHVFYGLGPATACSQLPTEFAPLRFSLVVRARWLSNQGSDDIFSLFTLNKPMKAYYLQLMTNGQAKTGWEKQGLRFPIFTSKYTLKYGKLYSKYLLFTPKQISVKFPECEQWISVSPEPC